MSTCESCLTIEENLNSFSQNSETICENRLNLCKKCHLNKENKLITKTNAKKEYMLNDKDIEKLRYITRRNSFRHGINTTLYLVKEIEKISDEKYGNKEKRENIRYEKNQKKEQKEKQKECHKENRRKNIDNYLKNIGLSGIRSDSMLCENYIEKGEKSRYNIIEIGIIMKEMDFYYSVTEYPMILSKMRREQRKEYEYSPFHIEEYEEILRREAKSKALKKFIDLYYKNIEKMELVPESLKQETEKYCKKKQYPLINTLSNIYSTSNNNELSSVMS